MIVRVYYSGPDSLGRYHFAEISRVTGGFRTSGTVLHGQHFFCVPPKRDVVEFRDEQEALRALGPVTETCCRCGMGRDRHSEYHEFTKDPKA